MPGGGDIQIPIESAPDAIVVVDRLGRIDSVNALAERMFGYERAELIGRPIELLVPERLRPRHEKQRDAYSAHPKTRPMGTGQELLGRRKNGAEFPVEISLSPLQHPRGPMVVSIIRDVSDRVRAEAERRALHAAQIRAEEVSRAKDTFLMTLSHELRTPLTAILGWSSVLMIDPTAMPDRVAEAVAAINNSAAAQARIIDDVLEISRIMSGKIDLRITLVDPVAVLNAALQTVRPIADARNIRIVSDIGASLRPLPADADRLQQVFWNLLVNAIKYSPRGSRVEVRMLQSGSHLEIEVSDQGEGIDPSFLPFVFEPFLQADSSTTRAHGGLGLGLSLVRQIVELHGGQVSAGSAGRGKGSTFTIILPVLAAMLPDQALPDRTQTAAQETAIPELPRNLRILYVDDDGGSRAVVQAILELLGARVTLVASAREALAHFCQSRPDLVVTDVAMPQMDGYQLLAELRRVDATIPVMALTALTRADGGQDQVPEDFDAVVRKPTDARILGAAIRELIQPAG